MEVANNEKFRIERLELGPFGTNAYIVVCRATGASVLVDAPDDPEAILGKLGGTSPQAILMTHNHFDHFGALARVKSALGVPVAAHAADAAGLPVSPDLLLEQGGEVPLGGTRLQVLHTPGHTPGSLAFVLGSHLLSGDTLFPGGPGKTASPAHFKQIVESITGRIFCLPDDTQVHPGHGGSTELGREKRAVERFLARPHRDDLCGDVLWDSP